MESISWLIFFCPLHPSHECYAPPLSEGEGKGLRSFSEGEGGDEDNHSVEEKRTRHMTSSLMVVISYMRWRKITDIIINKLVVLTQVLILIFLEISI